MPGCRHCIVLVGESLLALHPSAATRADPTGIWFWRQVSHMQDHLGAHSNASMLWVATANGQVASWLIDLCWDTSMSCKQPAAAHQEGLKKRTRAASTSARLTLQPRQQALRTASCLPKIMQRAVASWLPPVCRGPAQAALDRTPCRAHRLALDSRWHSVLEDAAHVQIGLAPQTLNLRLDTLSSQGNSCRTGGLLLTGDHRMPAFTAADPASALDCICHTDALGRSCMRT